MARAAKPELSKKQVVVDYLTAHPEATAADVAGALQKQGVEVSAKRIHTIKWAMNKEQGQNRAAKKAPEKRAKVAEVPTEASPSPPAAAAAPVNKTQAVREYLAKHRTATPKEISAALKAQGVEVSSTYVSGIKCQVNRKPGSRKQAKPAPAPEAVPAVPSDAVSLGLLQKAKKLAAQLGGVKAAKAAIDALSQLMD